jgi:4-hydroxybenzoate polyprenyltransferase
MVTLAGGNWRQVGLAARFGRAFAVAAQLEDDFADRELDRRGGRQTIPTVLGGSVDDDVVEATTWVLMRSSLRVAAAALSRLDASGTPGSTAGLWDLLPKAVRQAGAASASSING